MFDELSPNIDYLRDREPAAFSSRRMTDSDLAGLCIESAREDLATDLCAALDLDRDDAEDVALAELIVTERPLRFSKTLAILQARNFFSGSPMESDAEVEKAARWSREYERERGSFASIRITRGGRRAVYRGTRRS